MNGSTFSEFYGALGGRAGQDLSSASDSADGATNLLNQAQNLRSQTSAVSLDQEAERLIEFQRGYQATAKLIQVIDNLTQSAIDILHP